MLITDCADVTRHFIDFFAPSLVFIKPILLQLKESIQIMDQCEDLRKSYLLNPINEGDAMGLPANRPVSYIVKCVPINIFY